MAEPTAGGVPLWPVTTAMGDTVYVRSDKIDNEPVLAAFSEDGARRPRDVSRAEISGAPDGSGFWNTGFGGYLKNSYDALQRGVKSIPEAVGHYAQEYGKPAAEVAANLLPGAGLTGGWKDSGRGAEALKRGDYGQAAIDYANTGLNVASELLPPLKMAPAIFAGIGAKTANLAKLRQAEEMTAKGAPRGDVWTETGWFQGKDGKWRFEIPDDRAKFRPGTFEDVGSGASAPKPLGEVIDHPEMFAAYPELKGVQVYHATDLGADLGRPSYNRNFGEPTGSMQLDTTLPEARGTTLSSAQMAVQDLEEFTPPGRAGGVSAEQRFGKDNPVHSFPEVAAFDARERALIDARDDEWDALAQRLGRRRDRLSGEVRWEPEDEPLFGAIRAKYEPAFAEVRSSGNAVRREVADRSAGAVETRNIAERSSMGHNARRGMAPWETEDLPAGSQWEMPANTDIRNARELQNRELAQARAEEAGIPGWTGAYAEGSDTFVWPLRHPEADDGTTPDIGGIRFALSPEAVTIRNAGVEEPFRGKGYGRALYENLTEWALGSGRAVQSDAHLTPEAAKIYDALGRSGYVVEINPTARPRRDGGFDADGPVFTITGFERRAAAGGM